MRMNGRQTLCALLVVAMLLLLGASGASADVGVEADIAEGASVSQSADIVAAVTVDFTTMDPQDASDTLSGGIQRLIMDGFFGFDDDMNVIDMLATGYTANDDATEYVLTLRQGVAFTDGTPWNADAALANVAKWADKSLALKRTAFLSGILESWEKVDDYTVKIVLNQSFGSFINALAHPCCVIMSPRQIEAGVEVCAEQPVGTGQYKFVEWVRGDHLTLELNKDWWGYAESLVEADAGFKTITFKPVPEGATRVAMVQSGDAQLIWTVPSENVAVLEADSAVSMYRGKSLVAYYIMMNNMKAPYSDVRVRQALNYALDKNAYLAVVNNGVGSLPTSIIGPDTQFATEQAMYEYDIEKAKSLLAEAGYPDGFKANLLATNTSTNMKIGEFLKQQWSLVGVDLNLQFEESAIVNSKLQDTTATGDQAEMEINLTGWSSSTGDADWALRPLFATESFPPLNYNLCYYSNAEVDELLKKGLSTSDPAVRAEAYDRIQQILWEECPLITTHIANNTWATSTKLAGVKIFPDGAVNLRHARMAP